MTLATDLPPAPGEIVRVRSRRYLVEAVESATAPEDQSLVRLACLEDDAEGEELEVLWEKEVDAQRISTADWTRLAQGHFDDPRHFGAYYHTLRWNSVTSTDPQLFQAPYRAGIRPGRRIRGSSSRITCCATRGFTAKPRSCRMRRT